MQIQRKHNSLQMSSARLVPNNLGPQLSTTTKQTLSAFPTPTATTDSSHPESTNSTILLIPSLKT